MGGKWAYCIKTNSSGIISRFKARYVAKGYSQIPGRDFSENIRLQQLSCPLSGHCSLLDGV